MNLNRRQFNQLLGLTPAVALLPEIKAQKQKLRAWIAIDGLEYEADDLMVTVPQERVLRHDPETNEIVCEFKCGPSIWEVSFFDDGKYPELEYAYKFLDLIKFTYRVEGRESDRVRPADTEDQFAYVLNPPWMSYPIRQSPKGVLYQMRFVKVGKDKRLVLTDANPPTNS